MHLNYGRQCLVNQIQSNSLFHSNVLVENYGPHFPICWKQDLNSNSLNIFYKVLWYHNTIFLLSAQTQMKNPKARKKPHTRKKMVIVKMQIVLGETNKRLFLVPLPHKNLGILTSPLL